MQIVGTSPPGEKAGGGLEGWEEEGWGGGWKAVAELWRVAVATTASRGPPVLQGGEGKGEGWRRSDV